MSSNGDKTLLGHSVCYLDSDGCCLSLSPSLPPSLSLSLSFYARSESAAGEEGSWSARARRGRAWKRRGSSLSRACVRDLCLTVQSRAGIGRSLSYLAEEEGWEEWGNICRACRKAACFKKCPSCESTKSCLCIAWPVYQVHLRWVELSVAQLQLSFSQLQYAFIF